MVPIGIKNILKVAAKKLDTKVLTEVFKSYHIIFILNGLIDWINFSRRSGIH